MRISFIGSGNVSTHLCRGLYKANHQIIDIFSQDLKNANHLAKFVNANSINSFAKIDSSVDLFIICVPDIHIEFVSSQLPSQVAQIHTSGSTNLTALYVENRGVFYPLQTFSINKLIDFSTLPILLESSNDDLLKIMQLLVADLGSVEHHVNSEQRKKLHLAAVFACNFSNLMSNIAEDILLENNLDPKLLIPLLEETTNKLKEMSAYDAQTGPAIRGDMNTIGKHQQLIDETSTSSIRKIYDLLTKEILSKHGKL